MQLKVGAKVVRMLFGESHVQTMSAVYQSYKGRWKVCRGNMAACPRIGGKEGGLPWVPKAR